MREEIFRKKSLEKVKSPENLDDYIQVSNPSVWLLLISIIILLIGACVWGVFGHIDSTVQTAVQIKNSTVVCYISEKDIDAVQIGQAVKFANQKEAILSIGSKTENGYVCALSNDTKLEDGFYDGKVVVKSYKPISFVLN